jgi:hypothetical protein
MVERFWLRAYGSNEQWREVTKEEYVAAERAARFHNPKEPATASFHDSVYTRIEGRTFPPD